MEQGDLTALQESSVALHEMYVTMRDVGFTEEQAFSLVAIALREMTRAALREPGD